MSDKPDLAEVIKAWGDVGMTTAGRSARAWLLEVVFAAAPETISDGALRQREGERSLARRLILWMDQGVSGGRGDGPSAIDRTGGQPTQRRASLGRRGPSGDFEADDP